MRKIKIKKLKEDISSYKLKNQCTNKDVYTGCGLTKSDFYRLQNGGGTIEKLIILSDYIGENFRKYIK